jgi:hypothetical protein
MQAHRVNPRWRALLASAVAIAAVGALLPALSFADSGPQCTSDGRSGCASVQSDGDRFFVCDYAKDGHSVVVVYSYMKKNGDVAAGYAWNYFGTDKFNGCRTDVENHSGPMVPHNVPRRPRQARRRAGQGPHPVEHLRRKRQGRLREVITSLGPAPRRRPETGASSYGSSTIAAIAAIHSAEHQYNLGKQQSRSPSIPVRLTMITSRGTGPHLPPSPDNNLHMVSRYFPAWARSSLLTSSPRRI